MQIFIKTLTGKTIPIDLDEEMTVMKLKNLIKDKLNCPPDTQRLLFAGKQLEDDRSPYDYGLQPESTVHLVLRNKGG